MQLRALVHITTSRTLAIITTSHVMVIPEAMATYSVAMAVGSIVQHMLHFVDVMESSML